MTGILPPELLAQLKPRQRAQVKRAEAALAKLPVKTPEQPQAGVPDLESLLVPMGGRVAAAWNGRDNPYGGNTLGPALLTLLDLTYPTPGGPWTYWNLKLWRRRDDTFVLERA